MTTDTIARENDSRSSAEIQSDIRETRGRMDATLDELGHRLTARSLVNSALDWWDGSPPDAHGNAATKRAFKAAARQVKHHPMPSLLIGAGVAWLISETMEHEETPFQQRYKKGYSSSGAYDTDSDLDFGEHHSGTAGKAKDVAAGAIGNVREKATEVGDRIHRVADRVGDVAHSTYDRSKVAASKLRHDLGNGYQSGAQRFDRALEEYPLAVGVAFAALGALAGLVLPRTVKEDQLMGDRSDAILDNAREKGEQILETGMAVGHRVLDTVKDEVAGLGITADKVVATLSQVAEKGAAIVTKVKDEATHAIEEKGLIPRERSSGEASEPW